MNINATINELRIKNSSRRTRGVVIIEVLLITFAIVGLEYFLIKSIPFGPTCKELTGAWDHWQDSTYTTDSLISIIARSSDTINESTQAKDTTAIQISVVSRTPESILKVIRNRVENLQNIYNSYLRENSKISGQIGLKFIISPSGRIIKMDRISSNSECPSLDKELLDEARKMHFDSIPKGNVTVSYTFLLQKK